MRNAGILKDYTFELNDESGATVHQTQTTALSVMLPATILLREGTQYSWEVSTRNAEGARVSNLGKIALAPAELRAQVGAAKPDAAAPFAGRVIYAAWLEQTNLKDEARKYWQALSAERPDEPRLKSLAEQ